MQFISHTIELVGEYEVHLATLKLTIHLLVPKSYISTDICSGFPYLIRSERVALETVVRDIYQQV